MAWSRSSALAWTRAMAAKLPWAFPHAKKKSRLFCSKTSQRKWKEGRLHYEILRYERAITIFVTCQYFCIVRVCFRELMDGSKCPAWWFLFHSPNVFVVVSATRGSRRHLQKHLFQACSRSISIWRFIWILGQQYFSQHSLRYAHGSRTQQIPIRNATGVPNARRIGVRPRIKLFWAVVSCGFATLHGCRYRPL